MPEQLRHGPGAFLKPKRKCHPSDINSSNSKYIVCVKTKQKQNKKKNPDLLVKETEIKMHRIKSVTVSFLETRDMVVNHSN